MSVQRGTQDSGPGRLVEGVRCPHAHTEPSCVTLAYADTRPNAITFADTDAGSQRNTTAPSDPDLLRRARTLHGGGARRLGG